MLTVTGGQALVRRFRLVATAAVVALVFVPSRSGWLHAEDDQASAQWVGILPETVPGALTSAIASLPDNWKEWGNALTSELSALYEKPDADPAAKRQSIAALRRRIAAVRGPIADQRYRPILNVLVSIASGLERRLDVIEAALDTLQRGPEIQLARMKGVGR